jgi:hypothetical protein
MQNHRVGLEGNRLKPKKKPAASSLLAYLGLIPSTLEAIFPSSAILS